MTQERVVLRVHTTRASLAMLIICLVIGGAGVGAGILNLVRGESVWGVVIPAVVVASCVVAALSLLGTTVLDSTGVHRHFLWGSTRTVPWPSSRTGLFVNMTRAAGRRSGAGHVLVIGVPHVIAPDGAAVPLRGLAWMGLRWATVERKGVEECSRLWDWAVARGYTVETGRYVPLALDVLTPVREAQERGFGLR